MRNFFMGREPLKHAFGHMDIRKANNIARRELQNIGIDVRDPSEAVGKLSGGERQCVAIARAVYFGARVLILDEPTSALGVHQTATVLRYIKILRDKGLSVIFITHNVHHAMAVGRPLYGAEPREDHRYLDTRRNYAAGTGNGDGRRPSSTGIVSRAGTNGLRIAFVTTEERMELAPHRIGPPTSIEEGLQNEWYIAPVPRKEIKQFIKRSDWPGIKHFGSYFLLVIATGSLAYYLMDIWYLFIPALSRLQPDLRVF